MLKALLETSNLLSLQTPKKECIGMPDFSDKRYVSKAFCASGFRHIMQQEDSKRKIAFVDGGNMELLASSSFSVHFVRIYFSIFQNNTRIIPKIPQKLEFFSLALAKPGQKGINYECTIIPASKTANKLIPKNKFVFDSFDETIAPRQNFRASISVIGSAMRRYFEWIVSSNVIEKELSSGDIILRDGTLETSVSGEGDYAKNAFYAAQKKQAVLCGLAKTSSLLTTEGAPLVWAIDSLAEMQKIKAPWFYHPVCENNNIDHPAEIFVCKLHRDSARAFRFEMDMDSAKDSETANFAFSDLALNSCDAAFLGYPYGLVDADAMARISYNEAQNYRAMLNSVLEKNNSMYSIQKLSSSIDAHDVLNDIIR